MKKLYFQCNSGISGDMTVAALLDLGADREVLEKALESLHVEGYHLHFGRASKCGIDAMDFDVHLEEEGHRHDHAETAHVHPHHSDAAAHIHEHGHDHDHVHEHEHEHGHSHEHGHEHGHEHPHVHRNLADVTRIIEGGDLTPRAKELALRIFQIVAEAESKAHGLPVDQVHFHEVGAVDSIVDIVAASVCLDDLGVSEVYCPYLCEGQGTVRCQHGVIPVPVPAVTNITSAHDIRLKITGNEGEMVTPTGAAIIAGIRTSEDLPGSFRIVRTGIGAGKKDFPQANILRVFEIEDESGAALETEEVAVLEANIDDQTPETLSYAMEKLFERGAKDVWFAPIYMKKNRPAVCLNVLCGCDRIEEMIRIILRETSSIGVRYQTYRRVAMKREIVKVSTPYGELDVKRCTLGEIVKEYPEYETAKAAAARYDVPIETVYRAISENRK